MADVDYGRSSQKVRANSGAHSGRRYAGDVVTEKCGHFARFLVGNALELAALGEQFDTVMDCGLFHVFDDEDRVRFVESLKAVMPPGGRYYMLCASDRLPGDVGPRRVSQAEIRASFSEGWRVDSIEPAHIEVVMLPEALYAWRATITRV